MKEKILTFFTPTNVDRPILAILLLLIGVFILALQDATVKLVSNETSIWQFQTLRAILNGMFLFGLAAASGSFAILRPKDWRFVYLRALMLTICMFCFFSGAPFLSISQMAAGLYTYPLFISLLAGPILGEKVGPWRISAILIGAAGASLMLDPFSANFSAIQILPITAGFFYACNILILRQTCRNESPLALAMANASLFVICGISGICVLQTFPISDHWTLEAPFVAIGWPELTLSVVCFAIFCSIMNVSGNICLSKAYQTADSSWLAPFDFSYLLFAAFWSQIIFDTWPPPKAIFGMILIAAAGIVTASREQRKLMD